VVAGDQVSTAREEVLGRIRTALADVTRTSVPPMPRAYRRQGSRSRGELIELFTERVRDYDAQVSLSSRGGVSGVIERLAGTYGLQRLVTPHGLPSSWRPDSLTLVQDGGLATRQLDELDGALTGCAVAIAETGTIVLDGQRLSGRRVLTLVPDHHICVVRSDQIVELVPEALAVVAPSVRDGGVPVTLISGPSASSDIELSRVAGVHGPRHLHVVIVDETAPP
jgi:L-lactate dehydrogenase complex protein LldG